MKTDKVISTAIVVLMGMAAMGVAHAGPTLRSLVMGGQSPVPAKNGGLAYFQITVTRAGSGSLDIYLSAANLPEGATVSFVPPKVSFTDQGPSTKNATMVVRVSPGTPAGEYPFTLRGQHGNSQNVLTQQGVLIVSSDTLIIQPPVLDIPVLQADGTVKLSGSGTALQPVLVQATTNLVSPILWETISVQSLDERGLFSLVDVDSLIFPARFYRLAQ